MSSNSPEMDGQRPVITLRAKFIGALLGGMVADGFGAPTQGWTPERVHDALTLMSRLPKDSAYRTLYEGVLGPLTGRLGHSRFHYTDDTQMTISVTESLVASGGFDGADVARRLSENFDAGRSYGPGIYSVLQLLRRGVHWSAAGTQVFGGQGSSCSGGASRVGPVALLYHDLDTGKLRRIVELSTAITHAHPLGVEGAVLQAIAISLAVRLNPNATFDPLGFLAQIQTALGTKLPLYQEALSRIGRLLTQRYTGDGEIITPKQVAVALGSSSEAHTAVPVALAAFLLNPFSFEEAILFAVRMGGDTDTQASLCGTLSGAFLGHAAIPPDWIEVIENEIRGRDYLGRLAMALFKLWQEPVQHYIPLK